MMIRLGLVTLIVGLVAPQPAAAQRCRISSSAAALGKVDVQAGRDSFKLEVTKVAATVVPTTVGVGTVYVKAPIRFTLRGFSINQAPIRAKPGLALFGGRLVLSDVPIRLVRLLAGGAVVKPALHGFDARSRLRVPCSGLTVGTKLRQVAPRRQLPPGSHRVARASAHVPVHRTPRAGAPLWVKVDGPMVVTRDEGAWVKIRAEWSGGSRLVGWVPKRHVTLTGPELLGGNIGLGTIGSTGCGRSHAPPRVTITVRRNAAIASRAGGNVWARTTKRMQLVAIAYLRADGWVRIADVPGIPAGSCSEHDKLWVHARNIIWRQTKP